MSSETRVLPFPPTSNYLECIRVSKMNSGSTVDGNENVCHLESNGELHQHTHTHTHESQTCAAW